MTDPAHPKGQLAFKLPVTEAHRREDFFASPSNAAALQAATTPAQRLLIVGPPGAGKTHLAHIWARLTDAEIIPLHALPARLPDLAATASVVIDNADDPDRDEDALFHLYNLTAASGRLLLTATTPPRDWGLRLPDLLSRLQTMPLVRIAAPDDALLAAVLVKLFADRQITVPPNLIPFLTSRMERTIAAARSLVAALDARSLAAGRPVNRALAADLLDTPDAQ